jgi:pimeloyl-ACP methyl ester carboxylesterase
MNTFFFGSSDRPLLGVYHPPIGRTSLGHGVVLCYPMGQEYMRCHRAFRQLGNLLARKGFHVFRFDYFATGDSAGEGEEASLTEWLANVGQAIEELKDNAGIDSVSIVGLRLGAALAMIAGAARDDVSRIVLWDPIVRGRRYVDELQTIAGRSGHGTIGVLGFPVSEPLREEIAKIDLGTVARTGRAHLSSFVSREEPDHSEWVSQLAARGIPVARHCIPSSGNWNEVDNFGSALLPQELIQAIVAHLSEEQS